MPGDKRRLKAFTLHCERSGVADQRPLCSVNAPSPPRLAAKLETRSLNRLASAERPSTLFACMRVPFETAARVRNGRSTTAGRDQHRKTRWVAGRALAAYQAAITGGIALGSWMWGSIANLIGVEGALLVSAVALIASPLLGFWMRIPTVSGPNELSLDVLADPEVRLSLTPRSGPIVIEIEYRVDPAKARLFYAVMQHVQLSRQRNGAYGWSIARDIADPELWTERFHCPTWHDYLRQRSRSTASERAPHVRANEFHIGPEPIRNSTNAGAPCRICALERGHA